LNWKRKRKRNRKERNNYYTLGGKDGKKKGSVKERGTYTNMIV